MSFLPLRAEELRIGLYVKLVGSWFKHPFPANTFKIQTSKDLAILRGLRNFKILYDPDWSDPPELPELPEEVDQELEAFEDSPDSQPTPDSTTPPENSSGPATQLDNRRLAFEQRRQKVIEAEKAYNEVLRDNKAVILEVKAGYLRGATKAEELVKSLGNLLVGSDGTLIALMNLMGVNEIGEEFYYHSLNVAILSMAIAHEFDLSQEQVIGIGMGALFHDIGEMASQTRSLYKVSDLTPKERQAITQHPKRGREMLEKGFNFPKPALEAISQHHERLNGTGYPLGLKENALHLYSKIIMVADAYDELSNNPQLEKSLTPYQALSYLYSRREEEFWEEAVGALIRNLGVYPPSSLVEMTDGSIGIVSTINLLERMKPTVMLYAPDIPRDEALIVDLAQDNSIDIKQCLCPKDVPKGVWKYLNPRGMISYFAVPEETKSAAFSHPK